MSDTPSFRTLCRTSCPKWSAGVSGAVRLEARLDRPKLGDFAAHGVASFEDAPRLGGPPDPRRRAREDDVAGPQGHGLAQMGNLVPDAEHQVARVGGLPHVTVDHALDVQPVRIADFIG